MTVDTTQITDQERSADTTYVIAGWPYWARGDTLDRAKARYRSLGGRLSDGYEILTFGKGSTFRGVNDIGHYFWDGEAPERTVVKARKTR
jgi:hypothetical protein